MPKRKARAKGDGKVPGTLIIVAAFMLIAWVLIAQHIYPGYSLSNNYISDLGVGATAPLFNNAIKLFSILLTVGSFFVYKELRRFWLSLAFLITAIGAFGVGFFPETTGSPHVISAMFAFGTIGIAAIGMSRVFKNRYLAYYSFAAGFLAIFLLALTVENIAFGSHFTFGIGHGTLEEILFYSDMLWALVVGYLMYLKRL